MTNLNIGDKAPDFSLPANNGQTFSLSDYKGQKVVLYFYPKDDTPGCTTQACDFNDTLSDLGTLNTVVLGVSKDPLAKHKKFAEKYGLQFPLLSDENSDICETYGVWVEKNMYGKKFMGIERSTFLIDEEGKIEKIWRKVKVKNHIQEMLETIGGQASAASAPE